MQAISGKECCKSMYKQRWKKEGCFHNLNWAREKDPGHPQVQVVTTRTLGGGARTIHGSATRTQEIGAPTKPQHAAKRVLSKRCLLLGVWQRHAPPAKKKKKIKE